MRIEKISFHLNDHCYQSKLTRLCFGILMRVPCAILVNIALEVCQFTEVAVTDLGLSVFGSWLFSVLERRNA